MTSREIVQRTLRFENPPRLARDMWVLPWSEEHLPNGVAELRRRWPSDLTSAPVVYQPSPRVSGNMYAEGIYVDEWGCVFCNLQRGIIGEVTRSYSSSQAFQKAPMGMGWTHNHDIRAKVVRF